ncbi:hypothetical protein HELRODRAFT_158531 [Helobdella robusta]|uniref:DDE-1 domain-containing protein n=1 Tax=Helobdella robusta TaxID=6412 RepID=T1EMX3_HELRO|nr:hypothetical protein HELRODRAFT_158531 [Helobdella robusta]ESO12106.1 hypothetical protein HELRODRAFT_158531 [Helobdella robusta]
MFKLLKYQANLVSRHKSISAINLARGKSIHMLTFPPHYTHKLQPLDKTYFKSLKGAYNVACDNCYQHVKWFNKIEATNLDQSSYELNNHDPQGVLLLYLGLLPHLWGKEFMLGSFKTKEFNTVVFPRSLTISMGANRAQGTQTTPAITKEYLRA